MRIFFTGGNGFVGNRTVRAALNSGHEAHLLIRKTSNLSRLKNLDFTTSFGDILDYDSIVEASKGCDACIHLACVSSWAEIKSPKLREIALKGTENVIKACLANSIKRFVYVSSISAINGTDTPEIQDETASFTLGDSECLYAIAKHEAEEFVKSSCAEAGLEAVIVNLGEVYGPEDFGMITAENVLNAISPALIKPIIHGGFSAVHIDDAAAGIILALEKGRAGESYILAGDNVEVADFYHICQEIYGKSSYLIALPPDFLLKVMSVLSYFRLPLPVEREVLAYARRFFWMTSKKAELELGYTHRGIHETLSPVVNWLVESGRVKANK